MLGQPITDLASGHLTFCLFVAYDLLKNRINFALLANMGTSLLFNWDYALYLQHLWPWRDLYCATLAVTRSLGFWGLIWIVTLCQKGYWELILPRILNGSHRNYNVSLHVAATIHNSNQLTVRGMVFRVVTCHLFSMPIFHVKNILILIPLPGILQEFKHCLNKLWVCRERFYLNMDRYLLKLEINSCITISKYSS